MCFLVGRYGHGFEHAELRGVVPSVASFESIIGFEGVNVLTVLSLLIDFFGLCWLLTSIVGVLRHVGIRGMFKALLTFGPVVAVHMVSYHLIFNSEINPTYVVLMSTTAMMGIECEMILSGACKQDFPIWRWWLAPFLIFAMIHARLPPTVFIVVSLWQILFLFLMLWDSFARISIELEFP